MIPTFTTYDEHMKWLHNNTEFILSLKKPSSDQIHTWHINKKGEIINSVPHTNHIQIKTATIKQNGFILLANGKLTAYQITAITSRREQLR